MRWNKVLIGMVIVGLSAVFFSPALAQFPGGGKKGGGFGGNPFGGGGFGGGAPGGGPGGGVAGMMNDPSRLFDMLAKGRPYFLLTETRSLRESLSQFAQERGITNGQITREQFVQFGDQMKTKLATGGVAAFGAPKQPGGFGGGFAPGGGMAPGAGPGAGGMFNMGGRGNSFEAMNQWADGEFNRRDMNGDSVLNLDEMPDAVKQDLTRWDRNGDNLIDVNEYRGYFMARIQGEAGDGRGAINPVTVILEEEFDKRPTVLRAGKLPKELKWFEDLDLDKDGQVALWEWRKAGKDLDEFAGHDRNDDTFLTPEEALRVTVARGNGRGQDSADGETSVRSFPGGPSMSRGNGEVGRGNPEEWKAKMEEFRKKFGDMGGKKGGGDFGGGKKNGGGKKGFGGG